MILLPLVTAAALVSPAATAPAANAAPLANAPVTAVTASTESSYTVRPGDTMSHIAVRAQVPLADLLRANNMTMSSKIKVGDTITIPKRTSANRPASAYSAEQARTADEKAAATGRHQTRDLIVSTARAYNVDPNLALAIAWQESRWSQKARSHKNAIGVMQCLPLTGTWMSSKVGRTLDLDNLKDNVTCGVALIRTLDKSTTNDRELIAAYYQGLASVRSRGLYQDTESYVASVQRHRTRM